MLGSTATAVMCSSSITSQPQANPSSSAPFTRPHRADGDPPVPAAIGPHSRAHQGLALIQGHAGRQPGRIKTQIEAWVHDRDRRKSKVRFLDCQVLRRSVLTQTITSQRPFEAGRDPISPNRNLAPLTTTLDDQDRLGGGCCRLSELAQRYGTPLYVLDEATLRAACRAYRDALERHYAGPSLPIYASKANSSLLMSSLVASEQFGLDAVSACELLTALQGGMPGERMVLHGNNKSDEELLLAYRNNVTIVVDNQHDLDRLAELIPADADPARLMLRFTPGIECHTHEYIRTGHLDSKFGFDPVQLEPVLKQLVKQPWARVTGLHAHIGSQIFELEPHRDLAPR